MGINSTGRRHYRYIHKYSSCHQEHLSQVTELFVSQIVSVSCVTELHSSVCETHLRESQESNSIRRNKNLRQPFVQGLRFNSECVMWNQHHPYKDHLDWLRQRELGRLIAIKSFNYSQFPITVKPYTFSLWVWNYS